MNCNEAVAALVASLESGTPISDEQRAHVQTCDRCREMLDSAKQLLSVAPNEVGGAPALDNAVAAAEAEVLRRRVRRVIGVIICVALFVAAGTGLMLLPGDETGTFGFWMYAIGMAALISAGFFIPILTFVYLLRDSARRRIYKRMKPGRIIHGVCLGLAEKTNMDVVLVRLIFLSLLILAGGMGFWCYVALDVAMPVHPDDRQYLLRFRLRRWLARRNEHADHHAG